MSGFFDTKIEFLKSVGPAKAELLNKELNIFTFGDLIQHYPFRYEDRTRFYSVSEIESTEGNVQLKGKINRTQSIGQGKAKRFIANFVMKAESLNLSGSSLHHGFPSPSRPELNIQFMENPRFLTTGIILFIRKLNYSLRVPLQEENYSRFIQAPKNCAHDSWIVRAFPS
jgi:hypothetical protein